MTRSTTRRAFALSAAVSALSAGLAAAPAFAQDGEEADNDVIVVTAQRREQSILDVAASVSALGEEALDSRGVARLDDVASIFPNVYVNTGNGLRSTVITIRGIASEPNNPGVDQSVGVFVDGVYQSRPTSINTSLYDLERIEVIRGPQGALYGKNTIAGALNIITQGPGEEPSFDTVVSVGNYDAVNLFAAGDVIFSPKARARVSLSSQTRSGFIENTATGDDLDDQNEISGRITFVAEPSDALTVTLRADAASNDTNAGATEILDNGPLAGTPFADADPEDRIIAQDFNTVQERDVFGGSVQLDWALGGGTLTSLTAYREFEWYNANDNDFTVLNQLRSGITEDQDQISQELRFTSALGERFNYIVGAFYIRETLDTIANAVIGPDLGVYPDETPADIFADLVTTSYAVFGQGELFLSEEFSITTALRYSSDEKEITHSVTGDPFGLFSPDIAPRTITRTDEEFTPSVSLNWHPSDRFLAYASYGRGYKSGGFNAFSITPTNNAEYDPEFVNSYEIGLKTSVADGAIYLAGSVFMLDYTDLQVNQLVLVGGIPSFTTSNAASAEATGFELEANWSVSDALSLSASYSYIDASFDDFTNATSSGDDYTGNTLPQSPEHTFSVAGDLRAPVADGVAFIAHADVSYRSELFFSPENDPVLAEDATTLLNARAGFSFKEDRWTLLAWGRNLTDETYAVGRANGVIIPGQRTQNLGAPLTWGVEIRGQF